MYDLLANSTVRDTIFSDAEPLAQNLVCDMVRTRERFVDMLGRYSGDKATFALFVADALSRQGISLAELAEMCETSPTTISRWAKGAAPSRLARILAVERLKATLDRKAGEIRQQLPPGYCAAKWVAT